MATIHWAAGVSGDFATADDWGGGVVPGTGDTAIIDPTGTYTVTLDKAEAVDNLTLNDAGATLVDTGTLTLGADLTAAAGTFDLGSGGEIVGGTLSATKGAFEWSNGVLSGATYEGPLNLTATNSVLTVSNTFAVTGADGAGAGVINLTGDGSVLTVASPMTLDNATLNIGNKTRTGSPDLTFAIPPPIPFAQRIITLGASFTIDQVSTWASVDVTFSNLIIDGNINADVSGGNFQLSDDDGSSITNNGTITVGNRDLLGLNGPPLLNNNLVQAESGGTLALSGTIDGSGGGTITASGGNVDLNSADVVSGTLTSAGASSIRAYSAVGGMGSNTLDGTTSAVTNEGRVFVDDRQELTIQGTIHNSGDMILQSDGDTTTLTVGAAGITLDNGGLVYLDNHKGNLVTGASSTASLTNVDNTIEGAGSLGGGEMALTNEAAATIIGAGSTGLTIDVGSNTISNAGLIEGITAAGATIKSAVDNTGVLKAASGELTVEDAVTGSGHVVVDGGTLTFASSFSQDATLTGKKSELILAQSQGYHGTITGFGSVSGDSLDLQDIGFVSSDEATYVGTSSGGVLTVDDGTHTASLHFSGDFLGVTFTAASDGHGGTVITDPAKTAARAPLHRFIAAASSFGATTTDTVSVGHEPSRLAQPVLATRGAAA